MANLLLKPSQVYERINITLRSKVVPFIKSSPGMGKSSLVAKLAEENGFKLIDVRASQIEPTDLMGLPYKDPDTGRATYLPFDTMPISTDEVPEGYKGWLLFLDEINHARQPVVSALYKLILDRKVGNYDLHPKVKIICAGNLDSDKAQTIKLSTAFNSRVAHLYMETSLDDWFEDFAYTNNIDPRIISYLMQFKEDFYKFDPDSDHKSFCCPRSWHQVDQVIKASQRIGKSSKNNDDLDIVMFDGLLSPGVASKFVGYCDLFGTIPTITEVLLDPMNAKVPEANDASYATAISLASATDTTNVDIVAQYISRMMPMFKAIYATIAVKRDPRMATNRYMVSMIKDAMAKRNKK